MPNVHSTPRQLNRSLRSRSVVEQIVQLPGTYEDYTTIFADISYRPFL